MDDAQTTDHILLVKRALCFVYKLWDRTSALQRRTGISRHIDAPSICIQFDGPYIQHKFTVLLFWCKSTDLNFVKSRVQHRRLVGGPGLY